MFKICAKHLVSYRNGRFAELLAKQTRNLCESLKNGNVIRIAIIGSGPSGFYTAQQLLKDPRVLVDIYEKYPVPFGLVRFGVAPDHQEVKNVINSFTTTAVNSRTCFIGNVSIGSDITLNQIRDAYNAVVLCYGATQDRMLDMEGEHLPNVISARRFVGWYNGVPNDKHLAINLDCDTAVILGHGNVAIDCARILLSSQQSLQNSDITDHALSKLKRSQIKNVYIVGRRSALHVSFTIKEFRELTKMDNCETIISQNDCEFIDPSILESLARPRKRLTELIINIAKNSSKPENIQKTCTIKFFRRPVLIKGDKIKGVDSVIFGINKLDENSSKPTVNIVETDDLEEIRCGLVLRSIGYKAILIDASLPFDQKKGTILNENGRVIGYGCGLYCSGWAATGAVGVILNTMNASFEVARNLIDDINTGKLRIDEKPGSKVILEYLRNKGVKVIFFDDWRRIDQIEQQLGVEHGKPREKIVDINQMIEIVDKKDS